MANLKIETSFPFPFLVEEGIASYTEVKKPSGVAYMTLVLINESKEKSANFSAALENFGIPKSLQYIFVQTIDDLIHQDILCMSSISMTFDSYEFENYKISDFSFTEKGKKIFAEESIPTGIVKEARFAVFYNVALNELTLKLSPDLEAQPLMNNAISEDFIRQFNIKKNVEDYLNLCKGERMKKIDFNRIIDGDLIKKNEVITHVEKLSTRYYVGKYDCDISLLDDQAVIHFEKEELQKFFNEYYSKEMIQKALEYKKKFTFDSNVKENIDIKKYSNKHIDAIFMPYEINDICCKKGQLCFSNGVYKASNSYEIIDKEIVNKYDENCAFIIVDYAGKASAYILGKFQVASKNGKFDIPLVLKVAVTKDELQEISAQYIDKIKELDEKTVREVVTILNINDNTDRLKSFFKKFLNNDSESNYVNLKLYKRVIPPHSKAELVYKDLMRELYDEYLQTVDEQNLELFLIITKDDIDYLTLSSSDILPEIIANIMIFKNKQKAYELLVENGFQPLLVAYAINPVKDALANKKSTDKTLSSFINYHQCIENMKNITGIKKTNDFVFSSEEMDKEKIQTLYKTAFSVKKEIEIFRHQNKELFDEYDAFMNVFGKINDDFNIEENALRNIKNITPTFIEKKIVAGEYQTVLVNLSAKLELILKSEYGLDGSLSTMLYNARNNKLLDNDVISTLYNFKEIRNSYIHPNNDRESFTADDLRKWNKAIFDLEEEKE